MQEWVTGVPNARPHAKVFDTLLLFFFYTTLCKRRVSSSQSIFALYFVCARGNTIHRAAQLQYIVHSGGNLYVTDVYIIIRIEMVACSCYCLYLMGNRYLKIFKWEVLLFNSIYVKINRSSGCGIEMFMSAGNYRHSKSLAICHMEFVPLRLASESPCKYLEHANI